MQRRYRHNGDTVVRKVADEILLVPVRGSLANLQRIFMLNEVGEFIWSRLDGRHTVEEIVASVANRFDVQRDRALQDIEEFIVQLLDADLITEVA